MDIFTKLRSKLDGRRQAHGHGEDDSNTSLRHRYATRADGSRENGKERQRMGWRESEIEREWERESDREKERKRWREREADKEWESRYTSSGTPSELARGATKRWITSNENLTAVPANVVPEGPTQELAQDLENHSDLHARVSTYTNWPISRGSPENMTGIRRDMGVGYNITFPPRYLSVAPSETPTIGSIDTTPSVNVSSSTNTKTRIATGTKAEQSTALTPPCLHKTRTGCALSIVSMCCACEDQRPHDSEYLVYIDGLGTVPQGTRWQAYCSSCSDYWSSRKGLGMPNPRLMQKVGSSPRVKSKASSFSYTTPLEGRDLEVAPPPYSRMKLTNGVLFASKSGWKVSSKQSKEQKLQEWLQQHFEKTVPGRRPSLKPKSLPNSIHIQHSNRYGCPLTDEDTKVSYNLGRYHSSITSSQRNYRKERKSSKDDSFTKWRTNNRFEYEPEPDCNSFSVTRKTEVISTRNLKGRYTSFFRPGEPFSALLNNQEYGIKRKPIKALTGARSNTPLRSPKAIPGESGTDFYHFIYWIDKFWRHDGTWENWTSQTPAWMIDRGLPTVGDLRSYIARKLQIRDPLRLRLHVVVSGITKGSRSDLVDDTMTLKNAGINSDCHIVVGWVDGIWIESLLPGLNNGRKFLLCVPGMDSGKARVGNIRIHVAKKLRIPDPRMIRLFIEDKELLDDRRTTEQESLHWAEGNTASNDRQLQCAIILEDLSSATKPWRAIQSGKTCRETTDGRIRTEEVLSSILKLAMDAPSQVQKDFYEEQIQHFRRFESFKWTTPDTQCCIVCSEDKYPFEFPTSITRRCDHSPHICDEDLIGWVASELQSKSWDRIKCPECPELLHNEDVKSHAAAETFERYEGFEVHAALSTMPDFYWCLAPNCSGGQIHESGVDGPIFRCNACGYRVCIHHNLKWHENETCEQFDYRVSGRKQRDEEEATKRTIAATTKKCTKCLSPIEKNKGCDHMTCSRCGSEFCWLCLADYTPIRRIGNSEHAKSCIYHTNNIRA